MHWKKRTRLLVLLLLVSCLLPEPVALAAPWRSDVPTLEELSLRLTQLFSTAKRQSSEEGSEQPVEASAEDEAEVETRIETYSVRAGDTLWDIARARGVTVTELRTWNNLSGNMIRIGQVLQVGKTEAKVHTVKTGETLWSIATRYSTSVAALATVNGLSSAGAIHPGDSLTIPSGSGQAVSRGNTSYRLIWPIAGTITSGWGYRTRFEKFHYGLDIAANTGTAIKAVMSGVVEYAGWKSGYGYCVFIDHGNGLKTAYGHASKLYVKKGQRVSQNQKIAAVGSTGFSTGPHLHLEVRVNGTLVNPIKYLP